MYKVIELEIDPEISGDTGVFEVAWVEYPAIEQELIYFGQQKFYKAPENVSAKACRAIKENEERGNPAATQVGKVRAQQLCQRDEISLETIKRMKSYLERAAEYYTGNYDDNGTISYDLWGGKPALEWVDGILKNLEMGTQDFVKPGPAESKDDFIGRCIAYVLKEGKTPDQAAGQCYGMWENREFAPDKVSFDWDETLSTSRGKKLLEQELSRGSIIYIISARNLTSQEMYDVSLKYGFPASNIYTTGSNKAKIEKVKELGIKRHYDNNFQVIRELGPIGIRFDYDVSGLPSYENYPPSGATDSMLVEPELPSTLYEGCGCGQGNFQDLEDACWEGYIPYGTKIKNGREVPNCVPKEDFEKFQMFPGQVGVIDGHPIFETITDAENHSIYIGCVGHHTHTTVEGNQVYMACDKHPETDYSEYTTEDFEMKKQFDFLRETLSPQEFEAITNPLLRGFTESEIYSKNHNIPTTYFQYARVATAEGMDRDFCMSIEGRYFRRAQIDTLRDTNVEFGHQRQPYSKWLYKGGPNCIHAWIKVVFQGRNKAVMGPAEGKAGIAPKNQPFNGYYSEETRQASRRAYAISQNMSSVSYMKDIECAFGDVCKPRFDKKSEQVFAAKEEERMIYTPLMIPNILIPRIDEVSNEKYYVKFTPETIKNIRDKFMAELRNRMTNYEHTDKKFEDVVMVETWIVQGEKDKAYELGFTQEQVPFGSWMGAYKVLDTEQGNYVWNNYIKPGKVKGASVEGNFILNFSQQKGDEYLLEQVINIINQITD